MPTASMMTSGPSAVGQLHQFIVNVAEMAVDEMRRAGFPCHRQLSVVHIDRNYFCVAIRGGSNRPQAHHAATDHRHRVFGGHAPPRGGVEANRKRLHDAQFRNRQAFRDVKLAPGRNEVFLHRPFALHAQSLVELARVHAAAPARCALAAIRIRRERDVAAPAVNRSGTALPVSSIVAAISCPGMRG